VLLLLLLESSEGNYWMKTAFLILYGSFASPPFYLFCTGVFLRRSRNFLGSEAIFSLFLLRIPACNFLPSSPPFLFPFVLLENVFFRNSHLPCNHQVRLPSPLLISSASLGDSSSHSFFDSTDFSLSEFIMSPLTI